jgi:integrase/recombinase XerD
MQLAPTTARDYRQALARWEREGRPDPCDWVAAQSSLHQQRKVRAALIWHHRQQGVTLSIPFVPAPLRVPTAFTDEELARVRQLTFGVSSRCPHVIDLLYCTGARISELVSARLEDVTDTHLLLRETKRRPGGLQVQRAVPLNDTAREAAAQLALLGPGRKNNLIGAGCRTVQNWMPVLQARSGVRVHAHKFRATFATHMLARGVDVRTVQELMGHTNLATTMRYLAVTEERLRQAVAVLA